MSHEPPHFEVLLRPLAVVARLYIVSYFALARFNRLRELRIGKPCGCTQDWPNAVQELRASCNEQAREIHSLTRQREMMNRRDSQQTQQIDDLTQRVRDLERDLKRARQEVANVLLEELLAIQEQGTRSAV